MNLKSRLKKLIPAKWHYALSEISNSYAGYARTHYSQFGEDILIGKFFGSKTDGYYVDVGAHHPKRYSNTYLLHKKGWHGMNIDPNPHTKKLFDAARPKDTNIACGVGSEGVLTYYEFSDPAVNSFHEEEAKKWMHKDWIQFLGTKNIPVHPLRDLLPKGQKVNLLTIDTEGMDMEVLRSNDWTTCSPELVVVESSSDEIPAYMSSLSLSVIR